MRRSVVPSLPLQLVFPGQTHKLTTQNGLLHRFRVTTATAADGTRRRRRQRPSSLWHRYLNDVAIFHFFMSTSKKNSGAASFRRKTFGRLAVWSTHIQHWRRLVITRVNLGENIVLAKCLSIKCLLAECLSVKWLLAKRLLTKCQANVYFGLIVYWPIVFYLIVC